MSIFTLIHGNIDLFSSDQSDLLTLPHTFVYNGVRPKFLLWWLNEKMINFVVGHQTRTSYVSQINLYSPDNASCYKAPNMLFIFRKMSYNAHTIFSLTACTSNRMLSRR